MIIGEIFSLLKSSFESRELVHDLIGWSDFIFLPLLGYEFPEVIVISFEHEDFCAKGFMTNLVVCIFL